MKDFVLQARLVKVRAGSVYRNESITESDDSQALLACRGREVAARGFTAWLFRRERGDDVSAPFGGPLRLVETFTPAGHLPKSVRTERRTLRRSG